MGLVKGHRAALLCGAAFAMGLTASAATAQELQDDQQTVAETEQVTVESEKQGRVTFLQRLVVGAGADKVAIDTPQAVTVLNQEDIDRQQAQTVGEVLRDIPGVNTTGSDRLFGQAFNIRGIGAPESAGQEGRIIVNVDGANKFYEQYRMGGFFSDPELYKKVEVLRGPASSTLYGSGALGGVINFVTKDAADFIAPGENGALRLKGGFNSNRDGYLGSAILAQRMGSNAEFLLAGNYRRAESYVTGDGSIIPSSDFKAWSGLAKGTFYVGDEGTLRLSYQHFDSDAQDQDYAQVGTLPIFGTVDRHVVDKTVVVSYENPFSDNDWLDLKVSGSFSDTTVDQTDAGNPMFGLMCGAPGSELFCDTQFGYQTWQLNIENTSEWRGDNWENFLTYGWQTKYQQRTGGAVDPMGTPIFFDYHPEGTDFQTGVFVQNEFIYDERLTLIPGMRVDYRKLTPDSSTPLSASTDDWAFSPKLAAHYKLNDTFAVFGSVAHTERFPTLDEVFSTSFAPSYGLKKERSNNYEAGFAVSAFDVVQPGDGLQLKTTGFYNDISDLIVSCEGFSMPCGPVYSQHYVNLHDAHIYGAEVELAYDSDYVFASAGYTYLQGRNDTTGGYLDSVAPHEVAFTIGGKLPQHGLSFGWRSRIVSSPQNAAWRSSEANWTGSSRRFAQAFDVHDIFVSWTPPEDSRLAGWQANFGVDNIFDEQYKEFLHNDAAKGRTFKFSLAKKFGWR